MKVRAKLKNYRVSPRKARLLVDLIRGRDVEEAVSQLENSTKKTSHQFQKLLLSAVANAQNNDGLNKENLYVADVQIGDGVTYKRWMPRAYGRATPIHKRTSNILIVLDEREEGKGKKSKKELDNMKKDRKGQKKDDRKVGDTGTGALHTEPKKEKKLSTRQHKAKSFQRKSV